MLTPSGGKKALKFVPFSKYPLCYKDVSFWHPDHFHENDLAEVVRGIAGDLAEDVKVSDPVVDRSFDARTVWKGKFRALCCVFSRVTSVLQTDAQQLYSPKDGPDEPLVPNLLPLDGAHSHK